MTNTQTARETIAEALYYANDDPRYTDQLLDAFRDQVLTEAAEYLERIADETEARVAAHYGPASGIGPGSAEMVRLAAGSVRSLSTPTSTAQEG